VSAVEIVEDLNATSTIISRCTSWFELFFGINGYVSLNTTYTIEHTNYTVPVPAPVNSTAGTIDFELIIEWIVDHAVAEIR
jgi:hypothetical protein